MGSGGGRKIEEGNPGWENTGAYRDLIAQVEDIKGGATGQVKSDTGLREELLGIPRRGGKCRRAVEAVRQGRRPGEQSLRSQERWGGASGCKESEKRRLQLKDGGR